MNFKSLAALALAAAAAPAASAGIIAYGVCQTGCNTLAVSCYAGAGFVFGVSIVGVPLIPPAIVACNAGLGTCMAACAATALLAPIP